MNIICISCNEGFEGRSKRKFCSLSCSASFNNKLAPKRFNPNKNKTCLKCDNNLKHSQIKFCSRECSGTYKSNELIEKWIKGEHSGSEASGVLSKACRSYLIKQANYKCSECGWCKPNIITGKPILSVDHIDGNWQNNKFGNHKVLCYNCHTLTPTFGALNKNGLFESRVGTYRKSRRIGQEA